MHSIKEIARITGLSPATVSHALNGTRAVSKHSRELVQKAVEQTGYVPNFAAQALKTRKSYLIALILPSVETSVESSPSTNSVFFELLNGAREYLNKNNYELLVITYSELESNKDLAQLSILKRRMVDGVLLVPFARNSDVASQMQKMGLPIVLSDRRVEDSELPMVYADNFGGTKRMVTSLYEKGYRRIGFIGGTLASSVGYDRWQGYQATMAELCPDEAGGLCRIIDRVEINEGAKAAAELIGQGAQAICISNHVLLMGVMKYCTSHQVNIPKDVVIVGMDEYDWMKVFDAPIITMSQDHYQIGEKSAEMLLRQLSGEDISGQSYVLPYKITADIS